MSGPSPHPGGARESLLGLHGSLECSGCGLSVLPRVGVAGFVTTTTGPREHWSGEDVSCSPWSSHSRAVEVCCDEVEADLWREDFICLSLNVWRKLDLAERLSIHRSVVLHLVLPFAPSTYTERILAHFR